MKKIISIIFVIIAVVSVINVRADEFYYEFDRGECYPMLTVVVGFEDGKHHQVVLLDKYGNTWIIYDNEFEFMKGDVISLLMWQVNPKDYREDEIVEVYYEFHLDDQGVKQWLRQTQFLFY